ncbi:MAG: hypothetical protein ACRDNW_09020 [Trebonia sp.]
MTEPTEDDTAAAIGLDENELIADENCEPFSSSCTRLLFGVAGLKNVVQLVLISETAFDEPPAALDVAAGADDAGVLGAVEAADDEEELEPLEQADIAVTSTRPSTGTR